MELDKLESLIDLLRENGITHYRDGDLEITLGAVAGTNTPAEEKVSQPEYDPAKDPYRGVPENYRKLFTVNS